MKKVRIIHLLPKKYPTPTLFEFSVLIYPVADQDELCDDKQRPLHCKNGSKTSPPARNHQLPTSRAPLPRTHQHHGNHRAPGYLPGVPRNNEPRIYRVPSLQRHWAEEETLCHSLGGNFQKTIRCCICPMRPWELEEPEVHLHSHSSWKYALLFCVCELGSLVSSWIIHMVRSDIWPYTGTQGLASLSLLPSTWITIIKT